MENVVGGIRVNKRKSLREEVYDSLRRSIIHGKLKGGQRLIEETLAHQVGISRTPVREAFHKLERDDLVVRLPKGGFAVKMFSREDVEEIFGKIFLPKATATSIEFSCLSIRREAKVCDVGG